MKDNIIFNIIHNIFDLRDTEVVIRIILVLLKRADGLNHNLNNARAIRFTPIFGTFIFLVFCIVLCYCVLFVVDLCLVGPLLAVSLDCPFLIAPSVFSNVYFEPRCHCQ